ncbi:MAG: hypothetical protein M1816_002282 [Peltula sp. TS41687]|nr:MAG: hypothetical protein M1816_002282 [Peltula sp. TS41687]
MPGFQAKGHLPGGGDVTSRMLKGVALPPRIKCTSCKKIRNQDAFSNRQLGNLSFAAARSGQVLATNSKIKCRLCTGGSVTELQCMICEEIQGLEGFSKAQRKDPDKARCLKCVQMHLDTEPGLEPPKDVEHGLDEGTEMHSNSYDSEYQYQGHYAIDTQEDSPASLTMDTLTISYAPPRDERSQKSSASIASQENVKPSLLLSEQNVALLSGAFSGGPSASTTISSQFAEDDVDVPEGTVDGQAGDWVTLPRKGKEGSDTPGFVRFDATGMSYGRPAPVSTTKSTSTVLSTVGQAAARANVNATPNQAVKPFVKGNSGRNSKWAKVKNTKPVTLGGIYNEERYMTETRKLAQKNAQANAQKGRGKEEDSDDDSDDDDDYMKSL